MNLRRGLFRLAIITAIFVLPPAALYGWMQSRIAQQQAELVIPDAKIISRLPDARIISRTAIPLGPVWPFPWRTAVVFGAAGFVLGIGTSWIVAGVWEK